MVHEKGHSNHSNRQAMLPFISRRRHHNILKRIHAAMDAGGGGLKRIDENRELLELLHKEDPQFLESHPWVVGWFEANDSVLNGLVEAFESAGIADRKAAIGRVRRGLFPRPWPYVGSKCGAGTYTPQGEGLGNRLVCAARDGREDDVRHLIGEIGVHPDAPAAGPPGGITALHLAAGRGHESIVRFLLQCGANVNARDGDGEWTPLMYAAYENGAPFKMVRLLLEHEARPDLRDSMGRNALDLLREQKNLRGKTQEQLEETDALLREALACQAGEGESKADMAIGMPQKRQMTNQKTKLHAADPVEEANPLAQRQAASSQDVALVFPEIERAQKNVIKWTAAFVLGGCVLSGIEIFVILRMFHVG